MRRGTIARSAHRIRFLLTYTLLNTVFDNRTQVNRQPAAACPLPNAGRADVQEAGGARGDRTRRRRDSRPDRRIGKTRKALKEALTDLILEKGYEAVTVQDVIDRADVGRSTFYAHFVDKDDLLMAILADLEMPGLDPSSWKPDDPAFGWTLALFRHFGSVKRLFKAVAAAARSARRETTHRLEQLAQAELSRLHAARKVDASQLQTDRPLPGRDVHRLHGLVDARGERPPSC